MDDSCISSCFQGFPITTDRQLNNVPHFHIGCNVIRDTAWAQRHVSSRGGGAGSWVASHGRPSRCSTRALQSGCATITQLQVVRRPECSDSDLSYKRSSSLTLKRFEYRFNARFCFISDFVLVCVRFRYYKKSARVAAHRWTSAFGCGVMGCADAVCERATARCFLRLHPVLKCHLVWKSKRRTVDSPKSSS